MSDQTIRQLSGETRTLDAADVEGLASQMRGPLIAPDDPDYEEARRVYNAMIDKHPALVAQCVDAADVMACVNFARDHRIVTAVRGGGHNGPGFGTVDRGLVIDLSEMNGVHVDPEARTARVEGGAVWGKVDHATHAHGMATVSGVISTTGVAGLTLGGGHGYLSRKYGLTVDNLLSADVVLADGTMVTASEERHPDLFWALRGGGGNFGVVTSFEFQLHPVDFVRGGPMFWDVEHAPQVMRAYNDYIAEAPEEVYAFFAMMQVPPADPFPPDIQGRPVCALLWCCLGDDEETAAAMEPLREAVPEPLFEHVAPMPYPALQSAFDRFYPHGLQWYWRGAFVDDLPDEAIEQHMAYGANLPTPLSSMHMYPINGAVHDRASDETAFSYRDSRWSQVIVGVGADPSQSDEITRWTREYSDALRPYTAEGAYVNFLMDEEGEVPMRATFRDNYDRLTEIKATYDPGNLFRVNQNIPPAGRQD